MKDDDVVAALTTEVVDAIYEAFHQDAEPALKIEREPLVLLGLLGERGGTELWMNFPVDTNLLASGQSATIVSQFINALREQRAVFGKGGT